ncbi:MAG: tetratricopeptide repeat protein [Hyphomonadaceae bacterium]|nr:tetratricopeptide repeat protein [Hyphomonadaceae bacterium]MCA8885058.1 tetratricopeptide repeat protein [Hyphomonadaceae bacterium]
MSRAWLPRRFSLVFSAFAAFAALTSFAGIAAAQRSDPTAVTVVGRDPNARRCSDLVMRGDVSDETIRKCTDALGYRHLTQAAEIQLRINRGVTYMRRQENELALADFDAVIAIDRRQPEAQVNRGAALLQLHRFGPAIASFTEALGLGVQEPYKAYFNRGAAREALGDVRGAYEDYNTALEIYPDWGPANAELQRFARQRREHLQTVQGSAENQ